MPRKPAPPGAAATIAILEKRFPAAFRPDYRPLKIGITKDILAAIPDLSLHATSAALTWWTSELTYMARIGCGEERIHLDGTGTGTYPDARMIWQARHSIGKILRLNAHAIDPRVFHPIYVTAKAMRKRLAHYTETLILGGEDEAFILGLLERCPEKAPPRSAIAAVLYDPLARHGTILLQTRDGQRHKISIREMIAPEPTGEPPSDNTPPPPARRFPDPIAIPVQAAAPRISVSVRILHFLAAVTDLNTLPGDEVVLPLRSGEMIVTAQIGKKAIRRIITAAGATDGFVMIQGRLGPNQTLEQPALNFLASRLTEAA